MRKIIDGKLYDTETAQEVCDVSASTVGSTDFHYDDTHLYVTKKGNFFIAGRGGVYSRWAMSYGPERVGGGSGIIPIDIDRAKKMAESRLTPERYQVFFGEPEEA